MKDNNQDPAMQGKGAAEAMRDGIVETLTRTGAGWRKLAERIAEHATARLMAGDMDCNRNAYAAALAHHCMVRIAEGYEREGSRIAGEQYEARPPMVVWGLAWERELMSPGSPFNGIVLLEDVATFYTAAVQAQDDLDRLLSDNGGAGAW